MLEDKDAMAFKYRDDDGEVEEEFTSKKEGDDDVGGEEAHGVSSESAAEETQGSMALDRWKKQATAGVEWGV